jgi:hypothetical protein
MSKHWELADSNVHRPYRWIVADATELAAITHNPDGSEITVADGLYCVALQEDTGALHSLVGITPLTFKMIGAAPTDGISETIIENKGDLIVGEQDDDPAVLPVGADGEVLTVDSSATLGVKWTPSSASPVATTIAVPADESLDAGDIINLFVVDDTLVARKADATNPSKQASGFVKVAVAEDATATVYLPGAKNDAVSGLTIGEQWLSTTAGESSSLQPDIDGAIVQSVGVALTATSLLFIPGIPVTISR